MRFLANGFLCRLFLKISYIYQISLCPDNRENQSTRAFYELDFADKRILPSPCGKAGSTRLKVAVKFLEPAAFGAPNNYDSRAMSYSC